MSRERPSLIRDHILAPITALAFFSSSCAGDGNERQYILAGEDTDLKIYDVQTSRPRGVLPVFQGQAVHGIAVPAHPSGHASQVLLVWGGHSVALIPRRLIEDLIAAGRDVARDEEERRKRGSAPLPTVVDAPDWIFDARVSEDGERAALLTAHNEVIEARIESSGAEARLVLGRVQSPSRPNLYSGNFYWAGRDCVVVAAGTVFGEILVWKCHLGSEGGRPPGCEVLFVFSGHEGSVFGVHISEAEIRTPSGEAVRLLASCSDDRTVRVWDITERTDAAGATTTTTRAEYERNISAARETGFGDSVEVATNNDDDDDDDGGARRCIATAMGHVSRIWRVGIPARQRGSDLVEVYTFGEDATTQKWHLHLDPGQPPGGDSGQQKYTAKLTHEETFAYHSGKQIWSHAMAYADSGDLMVATGGADGKIALIGNGASSSSPEHPHPHINGSEAPAPAVASSGTHDGSRTTVLSLADVIRLSRSHVALEAGLASAATPKAKLAKPCFQQYAFYTDSELLITSNTGRIFVGVFGSGGDDDDGIIEWAEVDVGEEVRRSILFYSVLESSRGTVWIGGAQGDIYRYRRVTGGSMVVDKVARVHGKVSAMFCLSDRGSNQKSGGGVDDSDSGSASSETLLLVGVLGSTKAAILHFGPDGSVTRETEVVLETGFVITSATLCHEYLLLGSRNGTISIFTGAAGENRTYIAIHSLTVKRKDAITSILPLPVSPPTPSLGPAFTFHILVTCRDGRYRIYALTSNQTTPTSLSTSLLHEATPPFGPMIEGSWFSPSQDLMLCGFRGRSFVVWNASTREEMASAECGGAHRSFAYTPVRTSDVEETGIRFVFTKASQMSLFSQKRAGHKTIQPGGHGREVSALGVSGRRKSGGRYVATGAEDTRIRIWEKDDGSDGGDGGATGLRCVALLERHHTGIQCLRWVGDKYLLSSAGSEEFFVWRIRRLGEGRRSLVAVVCEAVFHDRSPEGDLRILDFDVESAPPLLTTTITQVEHESPVFYITMALSNSTVQLYSYAREEGFKLLGRRRYTGACLTQIRHLDFGVADHDDNRVSRAVLAAATDGRLAMFSSVLGIHEQEGEDNKDIGGITITKIHQNSIKALDMCTVTSREGTCSSYLVVTGGDDNALGITHVASLDSGFTVQGKSIVRSAHAAAITGVKIIRLEKGNEDALVVTASNDQRVKLWRVVGWRNVGGAASKVQLLEDRYSGIADAGDLDVLGSDRVIVAGVGMEVWRLGGLGLGGSDTNLDKKGD
ncbi:WD40 repeat-like protein [Xylariomycetidae sp. FL2044]|nr:WD40 repeat-like protein [Xylariomycetidae sp. FL2044]